MNLKTPRQDQPTETAQDYRVEARQQQLREKSRQVERLEKTLASAKEHTIELKRNFEVEVFDVRATARGEALAEGRQQGLKELSASVRKHITKILKKRCRSARTW